MPNIISITGASVAADLTGFASNVTGASWTLTVNEAGDDLAHKVTVRNDSATDHSAKTIALVGLGPNGEAQTETMAAPGTSATVTSTKYWLSLTSAAPSATIGSDTFDIGWAAASVSPWFALTANEAVFSVGFGCVISGTPTYTVQHSYGDGTAFDHATVAGETTNVDGSYSAPIRALRLAFAAAGTVALTAIQAGA
jgi:hypothetical protein